MNRAGAWVLSLALGGLAAAAVSALAGPDRWLVAATAASYTAVGRLSVAHPDTVYEAGTPAWSVGRWSGLAIAFLVGTVLFAPLGLGLEAGARAGLRAVLLGAGYAMWLFGVAYARAKATPEA